VLQNIAFKKQLIAKQCERKVEMVTKNKPWLYFQLLKVVEEKGARKEKVLVKMLLRYQIKKSGHKSNILQAE
jgi:hypothetical protein